MMAAGLAPEIGLWAVDRVASTSRLRRIAHCSFIFHAQRRPGLGTKLYGHPSDPPVTNQVQVGDPELVRVECFENVRMWDKVRNTLRCHTLNLRI